MSSYTPFERPKAMFRGRELDVVLSRRLRLNEETKRALGTIGLRCHDLRESDDGVVAHRWLYANEDEQTGQHYAALAVVQPRREDEIGGSPAVTADDVEVLLLGNQRDAELHAVITNAFMDVITTLPAPRLDVASINDVA